MDPEFYAGALYTITGDRCSIQVLLSEEKYIVMCSNNGFQWLPVPFGLVTLDSAIHVANVLADETNRVVKEGE